jgi:hypothetical protein
MRKKLIYLSGIVLLLHPDARGQDEAPLITDRPDQTESSSVVPRCRLQIETGVSHEWVETGNDANETNTNYGSTLLRFGVLEFLELRLGTDLLNHRSKLPGFARRDEFGMSPVGFGFKAALFQEKGIRPEVAIISSWQVPKTGRESFSSDKWQQSYVFAFSHTLSDQWGLGYNLGYQFEGAFDVDRFTYALVFGCGLSEKWGIFLETYGNKTTGVPFDVRADAGITFLAFPNFQLDLSGGLGITQVSPLGFISAGFSWRIPR